VTTQVARELEAIEAVRQGVLANTQATSFIDDDKRRQGLAERELPFVSYTMIGGPRESGGEAGMLLPTAYQNVEAEEGADPPYATDVLRIYRTQAEIALSLHVWGDPDAAYNDPANAPNVAEQIRHYLKGGIAHLDLIAHAVLILGVGPARNLGKYQNTEEDAMEHYQIDVTVRYGETIAEQVESVEHVGLTGNTRHAGESDEEYREAQESIESGDYIEPS